MMTQAAPSVSPLEALAERADDLGRQARRIRAISRTRPHCFLEDKQELARAIEQLGQDMRTLGRLPVRSSTFQSGTIAAAGRKIRVERRPAR